MTNKLMLSVERELIQWLVDSEDLLDFGGRESELRALLDKPVKPVDPNELSLGGRLARAATGLINVLDDETGAWTETEALERALEDWYMGKPTAPHQGETVTKAKPVAKLQAERLTGRDGEYGVTVEDPEWFNTCRLTGGIFNLYAEQPAPVAVELPERSSQDYAIEHAEYMAQSSDDVLAKFQAYGLALLVVDEGGDDGEGERFEAIDTARGDLQESLVDLRGMVYEFRKRSSRCTSL